MPIRTTIALALLVAGCPPSERDSERARARAMSVGDFTATQQAWIVECVRAVQLTVDGATYHRGIVDCRHEALGLFPSERRTD